MLALLIIAASICGCFCTPQTIGEIWPKPQQQTKTDQVLSISTSFQMIYEGSYCEIIEKSIQRHYPYIMGLNQYSASRKDDSNTVKSLQIVLGSGCSDDYPSSKMDESYYLYVNAGTSTLKSPEVWGALRGIESFSQLLYTDSNTLTRVMNKTSISDFPRFSFRGFLVDTSRHYLSLDTIKMHIDAMEMSKFNVFHWHIVDDQSFPFQSQVYPDLSFKGSYNPYTHIYTYSDVIEVLEYSRLRGIRVVPEFDTPGHTLSWGAGYPYLLSQCVDSDGNVSFTGPLEPRYQSTYDFVQTLFTEVNSLFPDETFFLGGDEVAYNCWESNSVYKDFIDANNLGDYAGLESYYVQKLLQLVDNLPKKRQSIVWQEVFDNGLNISKTAVVNVWKSGGYKDELSAITEQGYDVMLSAPWYLNYISYGEDWKNYYEVEPLDFNGTESQKAHFAGCEACMWGEYVDDTNFISRTWPRASAVAERAWSSEDTTDIDDAEARLGELRCKLVERGIPAEPLNPGFCQHEWDSYGSSGSYRRKNWD